MAIERIKLNLIPTGTMPVCHASQYDKKRQIGIDIYNGLQPYILSDELLELDVRKPDGHIVTVDVPYTADGNGVVFETTEQMCAVAGSNLCELKITKGEAVIGSLNFYMEIEKSPMENGLASDSEIANLTTQMRAIAEPIVEEIAPPIVEAIVPEVIGDNYYTKTQTDDAIATAIEGKADTTYVNEELAKKADKTDTYTKSQVDTIANRKMNSANPTGTGSIAVGSNMLNIGSNSQTFGSNTKALGNNSFATGENNQASVANQFVFGKYNQYSFGNLVEIVGNGTSESNRSNARTLDWQGNETLAGDLTYNGNKSLTSEISRLDGRIDTKANTSDVYTKSQTDNLLNGKADVSDLPDMTQYYDKSEVDTALGNKADQSDLSSLANVVSGLSDDVEALDQNKADKSDTYTKEQVDDIVYNILPDDTASGSVANFETSLEMPIKSLEVDVNAVQASGTPTPATPLPISGRSEINLYQLGGNFFNKNTVTNGKLINGSGNEVSYADWNLSDYIEVVEGASYYLYGLTTHPNTNQDNFELFDENKNKVGYANVKTNEQPYVIPSGVAYIKCCVKNPDLDTAQLGVSVNASFVPYNPTLEQFVINLGGTYYGGHFTQDKDGHRRFVVTHKSLDWSALNFRRSNNSGNWANYLFFASVSDMKYVYTQISDIYSIQLQGNIGDIDNYKFRTSFSGSIPYVYFRNDDYTDVETFTTAMLNHQLVYELATPIIIDLPDGEPINTLNGTNNIYADTGDCAVEYKVSVEDYVEKRIASVQALILNG